MRGKEKVSGEASLTLLAYNLKRVIKLLGVNKLIPALAKRNLNKEFASDILRLFACPLGLSPQPALYESRKSPSKRFERWYLQAVTLVILGA